MSWQVIVIMAASMLLLGLLGAVIGIHTITKIASVFAPESRLAAERIPRKRLFVIEFLAALVAPLAMFVSIPVLRQLDSPDQSGGYIAMAIGMGCSAVASSLMTLAFMRNTEEDRN